MKDMFLNRFLPMWAKETVFADNKRLLKQNAKLKRENDMLKSYIDGIHIGMKANGERKENG